MKCLIISVKQVTVQENGRMARQNATSPEKSANTRRENEIKSVTASDRISFPTGRSDATLLNETKGRPKITERDPRKKEKQFLTR